MESQGNPLSNHNSYKDLTSLNNAGSDFAHTRQYDKLYIKLTTERPVYGSCADVIANFLSQRPNAKIEVSGSVIK
jgi:hypothetical protein